ncbi:MAG TPA: flagellar hook capping FlgD N-terminal domain-containing protein [Rhodopila sp.]|nr:flagellar hook capping FlgD N-terminal domain-containing protein [Rhodopila sp.]
MTTTATSATTPAATVSPLNALTGAAATTQVGSNANNTQMNQFLTLLTAQLKNQDPTNPTDPTQFVAQLAQFSTVEQLTQSNTTLDTMSQSLSSMALGQYAGMINQTVTSNASAVTVPGTGTVSAPMTFTTSSTALSNLQVQVTDSTGAVVNTIPVSGSSGTFTFNPVDGKGNALPAGQYDLSLVGTAVGGQSQPAGSLAMNSQVTGVVQQTGGTWGLQLKNGLTVSAATLTSMN